MTKVNEDIEKDNATLQPLQPKKNTINLSKSKSVKTRAKTIFKKQFHCLNWIGDYNLEYAVNDFISGVTLGLTIIPESIACALLAGLPPHFGLCSVFIGSFVYLIFGTINEVIVGPTSLVALVSVQFTMGKPMELAVLLTFLTGCMELLMGILQLGFVFEFISMPVIKAFSSATAILVIESQIKVLLGIKYLAPGLIESIRNLTYRISEANSGDFLMGMFAIGFLLLLERIGNIRISKMTNCGKFSDTFLRYISLSRNTLIVLFSGIVSFIWLLELPDNSKLPYQLSKNSLSGLPNFTFPSFTFASGEKDYSLFEVLNELKLGIIVIPIVGVLTNISIGKLNPKGMVNSNQELITLGLCNIFGSSVQAMPVSGAFTRSAISSASGIKTPMANLYSGVIVILALSFLSPYLNYIPESSLAAILICAIVTLMDFKLPLRLWTECKRDFFTWLFCFITCLLYGVEVGLFIGIAVTVMHLLYLWARPGIVVKIEQLDEMQYVSVTPQNSLYFPAISHLRQKTLEACIQAEFQIPVVIDCHKVEGLDYTAAQGISKLSVDICQGQNVAGRPLLILYKLNVDFQKFVDTELNLVFCEREEKLKEILTQSSLNSGLITLKDHIRASIDLGYKIDVE